MNEFNTEILNKEQKQKISNYLRNNLYENEVILIEYIFDIVGMTKVINYSKAVFEKWRI